MSRKKLYLALAPLLALAAQALTACESKGGAGSTASTATGRSFRDPQHGLSGEIPAGWHLIAQPITGVIEPRQDLVAASFPTGLKHPTRTGCSPTGTLGQMPADGVLVQLIEYTEGLRPAEVAGFPPRPNHFRYLKGSYAPYECAGPSYKLVFQDHGRALQAHIWMHRRTVDPEARSQALRILDGLEFAPKAGLKSDMGALSQFRRRTRLCFTPDALITSGGERMAAAPRVSVADLRSIIRSAFEPTQRGSIVRAQTLVPGPKRAQLAQVARAVKGGVAQVRAAPKLLRYGHIPGFRRAQVLAHRFRLSRCDGFFRRR